MAIIKCKMCGGDIELATGKTFGSCEFCGSTMTFPKVDEEQRAAAFNRGNHFRRIGEFDKALAVYERIVREDDTDAEAHWCCALCRFGIEYVEDPATYEWLPTCHRASFDSFLEDVDYRAALEYSDGVTRRQYMKDGAKIAEVQRGILATSQNTEPYDVFICYKESDENGNRTRDSLLAQDIYYQLMEQGRKVFFARITLEDVAGAQYEPYIFAALNSAKVMIVVGTKAEHLNAVWVKNEWSRFLAMMKKDRHKLLLPCYRDMDPYDMPEQLSVLQSYDMAKIGFVQDLTRGIAKVLDAENKPAPAKETVVVQPGAASTANTAALLKRAFMFLEDGDWQSADAYCEKVLDMDPENARAYLGKLMAALQVGNPEDLKDCPKPFDGNNNYRKALRFADDPLKAQLTGYIDHINQRNEQARLEGIYTRARAIMEKATAEISFKEAAGLFELIRQYKDSAELAETCRSKAEAVRKDEILNAGKKLMGDDTVYGYDKALALFGKIPGWKDADECAASCRYKLQEIKKKAELERLERERKAERERLERQRKADFARKEAERKAKRNKKIAMIVTPIICALIAFVIVLNLVILPKIRYNDAVALMDAGKYTEAAFAFGAAGNYQDAKAQCFACWEQITARDSISAGEYHTVGLKADGTMVAVGSNRSGRRDVAGWTDIVAISAGEYHTVGLKADGTVMAVGSTGSGRCDVAGWTDIVAISAGEYHTIGLKADGTVVAVGSTGNGRCDVSGWKDIVAISAGNNHTVGLKSDGTVVAVGWNNDGQCDVTGWKNIVAISAGGDHTVGLKSDGTVVAVGLNDYGQCDVSGWKDIVAISAGAWHTVGLRFDGTVVVVGRNTYGQCDVTGWKDIVAISAGYWHTVGLKADGTVVAAGHNGYGQCKVFDWKDILVPDDDE